MPKFAEIVTPKDPDLLFFRLRGREELARLGSFQLELLSRKPDIKYEEILGKNVTVKMALPDDKTRYYNGFVTRFSAGGMYGRYYRYSATIHPWLWFLTRTTDCKIFQDMAVPDIVKQVFADHPTADFKLELTATYRKWVYCVQYRETDFNFVSRLMEEEGMYYYIRHADGHHTVVITDAPGKHTPSPGYETIKFISPEQVFSPEHERIHTWDHTQEVQPGAYAHDDYDMERPSVELLTRKKLPRSYSPSDYEVFDYPGHYLKVPDGEQYASIRVNELGTQFESAQAATNARGVSVGSIFTLDAHPRDDQNDKKYLIVAASQDLEFGDYEAMPEGARTGYTCNFMAMPLGQPFKPRRATPKPFVQGPQTAVVVGPAGDEIFTDKYGRVKVQFHWDRIGKKDDKSSCWIRVSHPWAGKGWGAVATPRMGQEVIVDFLEGDPDQPIITGRVYNAEQMPPYELPANKTQTGMKSRSSLSGTPDNFNEIRFEDKKGSEQVFIHAEKNQDIEVENDETHWVGHDRKKTIDNDEIVLVKHDRTETVDNNETIIVHGERMEMVDKDETITIHKNRTETVDLDETITISGNRGLTVRKSASLTVGLQNTHVVGVNETIAVGGAQEVAVGGLQAIAVGLARTVDVGGTQTTSVGANHTLSVKGNQKTIVDKDGNLKVEGLRTTDIGKDDTLKVAKKLTITVGESIMIKTGDASISMQKNGNIVIKGKDITIEGSGAINVKASKDVVVKGSKIAQN